MPPDESTDRWNAWDRFVESTPDSGFMQSSWWADFRAASEFEHFGIILKGANGIVGGALVLKYPWAPDRWFYYIPEGPVLPGDEEMASEVFQAVLESLEERRKSEPGAVSHLRIEPRWQQLPGFVRDFRIIPPFMDRFREPRNTLCVDLRPAEEAILVQMKPKGRYNIRLAQRHGVSVIEDYSDKGAEDFVRIYRRTAARQEMAGKPAWYFRDLIALLASRQQGSVFFAEYKGRRLATALVVYFGRRATYFFGGSLAWHRRVMAPYLLHFEIMRQAKTRGHDWYDLWGVAPESEPGHRWANISVFKRKFGGEDVKLVPTMDRIYDMAAYNDYLAEVAPDAQRM